MNHIKSVDPLVLRSATVRRRRPLLLRLQAARTSSSAVMIPLPPAISPTRTVERVALLEKNVTSATARRNPPSGDLSEPVIHLHLTLRASTPKGRRRQGTGGNKSGTKTRSSRVTATWRVAIAMQATGWTLRSAVIWERPGNLGEPTAHDRPHRTYEQVFIFTRDVRYYFNREALGDEEDIWTIAARPDNPHSHCAPFPGELVDCCLGCGCPEGGIVLDPFLGSGTTAISALRSGRSVVGIELNPNYCAEAEQRILQEVGSNRITASAAAVGTIPRMS
jgi:hypothetical protein